MKKVILIFTVLVLIVCSVTSCSNKYRPIKSTDEELRLVGTVNGCEIYYDELRFAVLNNKHLFSDKYLISMDGETGWEPYTDELEKAVYDGIKYNYAIQLLLQESGYSLDNELIKSAMENDIEQIIDQCGSRSKYKEYLNGMYLTDRVLRFNISISYASNELIFLMNDRGAFDEKVIFDIELLADASPLPTNPYYEEFFKATSQLMSGEIYIQAESVLIPNTVNNAEEIAYTVLKRARSGESLSDLKKSMTEISEYTANADVFDTDVYFDALKNVSENEYTTVKTDDGYRILKRLPCDIIYIQQNCYTICYAYIETVFKQNVRGYASTLTVELTDFGKSLQLEKIK